MSRRDARLFVVEMLDACQRVSSYIEDMDLEAFKAGTLVPDAVIRNLEVIGEAAQHVPEELRTRHGDVPWKQIIGFRNVAIHAYFAVDLPTVWRIAHEELPKLVLQLQQILDEMGGSPDSGQAGTSSEPT